MKTQLLLLLLLTGCSKSADVGPVSYLGKYTTVYSSTIVIPGSAPIISQSSETVQVTNGTAGGQIALVGSKVRQAILTGNNFTILYDTTATSLDGYYTGIGSFTPNGFSYRSTSKPGVNYSLTAVAVGTKQ